MKKLVLVLALVIVCCFASTNLYAAENQPNVATDQPNASVNQANTVTDQPNTAETQPTRKFASGIFSIGGGVFSPGGDLNNFDNGYNGTFSAGATLGRYFGMGLDILYRESKEKKQYSSDNKINTFGLDYLLYFQPNYWRVQPYVAAGFGLYINHLDSWNGMPLDVDTGVGYGIVGKAGIRFFITDHLFIGAYGKYFTNWQSFKIIRPGYYSNNEEDQTLNLGGLVGNIELGLKF